MITTGTEVLLKCKIVGGTDWGNNGYDRIRYSGFASFVYQPYEIVQFTPSPPKEPYLAGSLHPYDLDDKEDLAIEFNQVN